MAGTLTISTLSDGTNSTSATNCIQGSAKAWVTFAGATGTVSAQYNVSSVTRTGVGLYTVNFTTSFSDTKYAIQATIGNTSASTYYAMIYLTGSKAVGSCGLAVNGDWAEFSVSIFR